MMFCVVQTTFFINITYNDEHYIPQDFNQNFTSVAKKLPEAMPDPPADKSFSDYLNNISMTFQCEPQTKRKYHITFKEHKFKCSYVLHEDY